MPRSSIMGAVHARIPMPTQAEQPTELIELARADARQGPAGFCQLSTPAVA